MMPSGIVRNRLRCASCNAIASPAQSKSLCVTHYTLLFSKGTQKAFFFIHFPGSIFLPAKTFQRSTIPFLTRSLKADVCLTRHYQSMRNQFSSATIRKIYNKHGKNRPENQQSSEQIWAVLKLCGKLAII